MSILWLTNGGSLAEPVEMYGTAKESWTDDKISCSVQLRCPWDDRYDVADNILLSALAWPYHAVQVAFATSCEISSVPTPATNNGSGYDYQEAYLQVAFESLNKKDDQDTGDVTIYDES